MNGLLPPRPPPGAAPAPPQGAGGLFDAHCHLQDDRLAGSLPGVLERARAAQVHGFASAGSSEADWARLRDLDVPGLVRGYGLHPWYVGARSPGWLQVLGTFLEEPGTFVGEVGLDHLLRDRDEAAQARVLREQVDLARSLGRPLVLHAVRALEPVEAILQDLGPLPDGFLCHAFRGPVDRIPSLVRLGGHFSIAATVLRTRNRKVRDAAAAVPLERLLLETDSPDLPPDDARDLRVGPDGRILNEPSLLQRVLACVASLRGLEPELLARATTRNAGRFYRCPPLE